MSFQELYKNLQELELDKADIENGFKTSSNPKEHSSAIRENIFQLSLEVFLASKNENVYWSHCPTSAYKMTYEIRLAEALVMDDNKIYNEEEFILEEINHLNWLKMNFSNTNYHPDLFKPIVKKIGLLELKYQKLSQIADDELLNYSDSSALVKVIYLHKTGILDYLRKKYGLQTTTHKLAELLSAITGENTTTLQPYLNPIYSPQVDQKKNPLNKTTRVKKVEKELINMGISTTETN
ncbi:hypothetical protein [Flavobacterium sp.]|uniref:hypothetical protein n=1 Tax=Flavobacterium sp. TaxID=239 RepID=UPI003527C80A